MDLSNFVEPTFNFLNKVYVSVDEYVKTDTFVSFKISSLPYSYDYMIISVDDELRVISSRKVAKLIVRNKKTRFIDYNIFDTAVLIDKESFKKKSKTLEEHIQKKQEEIMEFFNTKTESK